MRPHPCTVTTAALLVVVVAQSARGQCCGDCDNDGSVVINELITAVNNALGECATPPGCGLQATGQRTSYGAGSDGHVRAGVPLSATDNGDGTITDNVTGLMWEKKDDAGGIHDKDNRYTWGIDVQPYTMNGTMVTEFLPALNTAPCFAGHCDWRIPNIRELHSLVDYELFDPSVRAAFNQNCAPGCTVDGIGGPRCSCTLSGLSSQYWSSTTHHNPMGALIVFFFDGYVSALQKPNRSPVRAVRGGL